MTYTEWESPEEEKPMIDAIKTDWMELRRAEMLAIDWWHSIDLGPELGVTPGREPNPRSRDEFLRIPENLKGKSVIDIGAYDGLYSFDAVKRGAKFVLATDFRLRDSFKFASELLVQDRNLLDYVRVNMDFGQIYRWLLDQFDIAFFFGVLYHLKHPYLGLENAFSFLQPGGLLILETALTSCDAAVPILEFCEGERDGDPTNWNYPNKTWVEASLRSIGFIDIEYTGGISGRGTWHAKKG